MDAVANWNWKVVLIVVTALVVGRLILGRFKWPVAKQIGEVCESLAIALFLVFIIIRPYVAQAYYIPSGSMRPTLVEQDRILVNKFIYRFREPRHGDIIVFKSPVEANKDQRDFIKRVVGLPGDEIKLTPGYVTIGGTPLHHDELRTLLIDYGASENQRETRVKITKSGVTVDGNEVTKEDIANAANKYNSPVTVHPGRVYRNGKLLDEGYVAEDPDQPYPLSEEDPHKVPDGYVFVMGDNRNWSSDSRVWGLLERKRVEGEAMFIFWPPNRVRLKI